MRISVPILNMDMANYSEGLDPSYANLEFETIQVLYNGNGEFELLYLWMGKEVKEIGSAKCFTFG